MKPEFIIWGKAPNDNHESLLVSEHAGIRDAQHARQIMAMLESEHGCRDMRVQRLEPLGDASELAAMWRGVAA